jgi:pyruvate kinase
MAPSFRMDLDTAEGDKTRVCLPHPEIFAALRPDATLLVNDGKIRLRVKSCGADFAECEVINGGTISNRKGVNVPDVILPVAALSEKDRADLEFACELGIDWLALSLFNVPRIWLRRANWPKAALRFCPRLKNPLPLNGLTIF